MNTDAIKELLDRAHQAADEAIAAEVAREPEDMNVFDCGFAWVIVRPARGPLVNYCKKEIAAAPKQELGNIRRRCGDKSWGTGWSFWKPGKFNGQSVRIIRKGAEAFAKVLAEAGINAEVGSRLD